MPPSVGHLYPGLDGDLNVADLDVVTGAAGPGRRLVVWLQGCRKRCAGCTNEAFLPVRFARRLAIEDAWTAVRNAQVAGVTLSGGEPLLQAEPLLPLLRRVREAGLTTVCYTGYALEELRAAEIFDPFLDLVDLLIDGEYRAEVPRGGVYRPSGNQRLFFLSGRIGQGDCAGAVETEVRLEAAGGVMTGTLPVEVARRLTSALRDHGVRLAVVAENSKRP